MTQEENERIGERNATAIETTRNLNLIAKATSQGVVGVIDRQFLVVVA